MPFDFPLNKTEQQTYMESLLTELAELNDAVVPIQVTQLYEPTQADWAAQWEADGGSGALPSGKDLYWFDGTNLRGHFTVGQYDAIAPIGLPTSYTHPVGLSDGWREIQSGLTHKVLGDLRWRNNAEFWGFVAEQDDVDAGQFSMARVWPDGSWTKLLRLPVSRGDAVNWIGQNHAQNFAPFVINGYGLEITNNDAFTNYIEFANTTTLVAGQTVRVECHVTKREAGSLNAILRVADAGGSELDTTVINGISGATAPQLMTVEMTTTGAWTGIDVRVAANGNGHKGVFSGFRIFVDGVELDDETGFNIQGGSHTNWNDFGAAVTKAAVVCDWAGYYDGSTVQWILSIPTGTSFEDHTPWHLYLDGVGDAFVIFTWYDASISVYDTNSENSSVLDNASSYGGGTTWDAWIALDNRLYARNDVNAYRGLDEDGTNKAATSVDITTYLTGRDGLLYATPGTKTAFWEVLDVYSVADDTVTQDEDIFAHLNQFLGNAPRFQTFNGDFKGAIGVNYSILSNPYFAMFMDPTATMTYAYLSPSGERWLFEEHKLFNRLILAPPGVGTGRTFRVSTWSDPRPDFKILAQFDCGVEDFSDIHFDFADIDDIEYYDILKIEIAVEPTVTNQKDIFMYFNDTEGTSYYNYNYMQASTTRSHQSDLTHPGIVIPGYTSGSGGICHNSDIWIVDWQNPNKYQFVFGHYQQVDSLATTGYHMGFVSAVWLVQDAINKISFTIEDESLGERLGATANSGYIRIIGLKTRARYGRDGNDPFFVA